jgi:hypothetical protein
MRPAREFGADIDPTWQGQGTSVVIATEVPLPINRFG